MPDWLQLVVAAGIAIITGVAARLGWVKGSPIQPEQKAEVMGAIVDSRAVKHLGELIDFAVDRLTNLHDEKIRHDKQHLDEIAAMRKDMRDLTKAIRGWVDKESNHGS